MNNGLILIFLLIAGLFILYLIIYNAVKDGINKSIVGQYLESKHSFADKQNTFSKNDLDQN